MRQIYRQINCFTRYATNIHSSRLPRPSMFIFLITGRKRNWFQWFLVHNIERKLLTVRSHQSILRVNCRRTRAVLSRAYIKILRWNYFHLNEIFFSYLNTDMLWLTLPVLQETFRTCRVRAATLQASVGRVYNMTVLRFLQDVVY